MYLVDGEICTGCGACLDACAAGAISMDGGKARIDQEACLGCGNCFDACAVGAVCELVEGRGTPAMEIGGAAAAPARVTSSVPAPHPPSLRAGSVVAALLPALLKLAGSLADHISACSRGDKGLRRGPMGGSGPVAGGRRARHRRGGS